MQLSPKSMVGKTFDDRYELLELLGTGAFGSVFKARQLDADRLVAIKIFEVVEESDEVFKERVIREALSLGKLKHLNIVSIYHAGVSSSFAPYLVMEYISGVSARRLIVERRLNYVRSLKIIRDLANAMEFAHHEGVIHRDLKPENFILVDEPEPDTIKILDFGLAKLQEEREIKLTKTGFLVGSVNYMSPEQCTGQRVDHRADIYSLGICLFEMITGEVPFVADTPVGIIYKHINEALPELKAGLGKNQNRFLNELLQRATAKQAERRFQSMAEFAESIDLLLNELGDDTVAINIEQRKSKKGGGRFLVLAAVSISAVLGIGLLLLANTSNSLKNDSLNSQLKPKLALDARRARANYIYTRMQSSIKSCEKFLEQKNSVAAGDELASAIRSLLTCLHNSPPKDSETMNKLYLSSGKIAELAVNARLKDSFGLEVALRTMAYEQPKRLFPNKITANLYLIAARLARAASEEEVDSVRYFADAANCRIVTGEAQLAEQMLNEGAQVQARDKVDKAECENLIFLGRAQVCAMNKMNEKALEYAKKAARQWLSMPYMRSARHTQEMRSCVSVLRSLGDDKDAGLLQERADDEVGVSTGIDTLISEEAMMEKIEKRRSH